MTKTAVIGASGYIGRHLWRAYRSAFPDCVGTTFATPDPALRTFDIRQPDLRSLRLEETGHEALLIASAKPNVAFCRDHPETAYEVNVRGMLELIRQAGQTGLRVIFLSSDYVFDGGTGRYDDDTPTQPTTEYGRQKAMVERELPSLADNHLILRLSKIYGLQKGDQTLLDEMASTLAAGRPINAARDQMFCPTFVNDLVRAIQGVQERGLRGVVNLCSPEIWSRLDIATALAHAMRADPALVKPTSLHDLPGMSERPLNTSMVCTRLTREVGATFMPLKDAIGHVAANWAKE